MLTVNEICKYYDLVTKSAFNGEDIPLHYSWHPILENQIKARLLDTGWTVIYSPKFVQITKDRLSFMAENFQSALSSKIRYERNSKYKRG